MRKKSVVMENSFCFNPEIWDMSLCYKNKYVVCISIHPRLIELQGQNFRNLTGWKDRGTADRHTFRNERLPHLETIGLIFIANTQMRTYNYLLGTDTLTLAVGRSNLPFSTG